MPDQNIFLSALQQELKLPPQERDNDYNVNVPGSTTPLFNVTQFAEDYGYTYNIFGLIRMFSVNFSQINKTKFNYVMLNNVELDTCDLTGIQFLNSQIQNTLIHDTKLFDLSIYDSALTNTTLGGNLLDATGKTIWYTINIKNCSGEQLTIAANLKNSKIKLTHANGFIFHERMHGGSLEIEQQSRVDLSYSQLNSVQLITNIGSTQPQQSTFDKATIENCVFGKYPGSFSYVSIRNASISNSKFKSSANYNNMDFEGSSITSCHFYYGANLNNASFKLTICADVKFSSCTLQYVDMSDTNITSSSLKGSDVTGINLSNSTLRKVDMLNTGFGNVLASAVGTKFMNCNFDEATCTRGPAPSSSSSRALRSQNRALTRASQREAQGFSASSSNSTCTPVPVLNCLDMDNSTVLSGNHGLPCKSPDLYLYTLLPNLTILLALVFLACVLGLIAYITTKRLRQTYQTTSELPEILRPSSSDDESLPLLPDDNHTAHVQTHAPAVLAQVPADDDAYLTPAPSSDDDVPHREHHLNHNRPKTSYGTPFQLRDFASASNSNSLDIELPDEQIEHLLESSNLASTSATRGL